eukprot:3231279-Amphidinium_carterae.2
MGTGTGEWDVWLFWDFPTGETSMVWKLCVELLVSQHQDRETTGLLQVREQVKQAVKDDRDPPLRNHSRTQIFLHTFILGKFACENVVPFEYPNCNAMRAPQHFRCCILIANLHLNLLLPE